MSQAVVTRVIDADTVVLDDGTHVRIRGIDSPEAKPAKKSGYKIECWGPEAATWANARLTNAHVGLIHDPSNDKDIYGRTVAEIWLNNGSQSYADVAVVAGMAREYNYSGGNPATNQNQLIVDQQMAMENHAGLWGPPCNGSKVH
jgi:micrococcal nuclease